MKRLIPPRAPLNIVPFIDIMLVLLCMVLSVSTFIAQGHVKVNLPKAQTQSTGENHQKPALMEVGVDNLILLDGQEVLRSDLNLALKTLPQDRHLELRIDERADFGIFISILDALRDLKHDNFSIATTEPDL